MGVDALTMIVFNRKALYYLLCLGLLGLVFFITTDFLSRRIKVGDLYIQVNPKAKIKADKIYNIKLWDYNWPIRNGSGSYRSYLGKAIAEFRKTYPQVVVEIDLLELNTGPIKLKEALKKNSPPDIYCSAFQIPAFDYQHQIPVGPYLKKVDLNAYYWFLNQMVSKNQVLLSFPRWSSVGLWIGNRDLLEQAGLNPEEIQTLGWSWDQFALASAKLTKGKKVLAGNPGLEGFLGQLTASAENKDQATNYWLGRSVDKTLAFLERLKDQKAFPTDFDSNMIGLFLEGKTMVLAGGKLSLLPFLNQHLQAKKAQWEAIWLPVPNRVGVTPSMICENGVISIYRNKKDQDGDGAAVAIKLGQFLSVYSETAPWEELMLMPAAQEVSSKWIERVGAKTASLDKLPNFLEKASIYHSGAGAKEMKWTLLIQNYLKGKIKREDARAELNKLLSAKP